MLLMCSTVGKAVVGARGSTYPIFADVCWFWLFRKYCSAAAVSVLSSVDAARARRRTRVVCLMIPGMNDDRKKIDCKVAEGIYGRGESAGGVPRKQIFSVEWWGPASCDVLVGQKSLQAAFADCTTVAK
jgi:hypothetical protein